MTPDASVVIPYFDDQARLGLLLSALKQQVGGVQFEVVIADDGSPEPPVIPAELGFACTVVRQPDHGFRAAAARNLGAAAAVGELLLFLDGDTLPTAGYLAAMVNALRTADDGHGTLVVGRRRHADLAAVGPAGALKFLRDDEAATRRVDAAATPRGNAAVPGIQMLTDPKWLLDGYARTDNLRSATDEDFRLVISAVLGVDRRLWESTGGFDGGFVGYGGEDWEFAWRAWLSGADFRYEPGALAWHDGPDAAGRAAPGSVDALQVKNAESLRLARTIALPSVRGIGLVLGQPEIVIRYLGPTSGTAHDAAAVACVAGLLAGTDAAVWFPDCVPDADSSRALPPLLRDDPRVHAGDVPMTVVARSRYQVWITQPLSLPASLQECCEVGEWNIPSKLRIRSTRSLNRNAPEPTGSGGASNDVAPQLIPAEVSLERWWAGW